MCVCGTGMRIKRLESLTLCIFELYRNNFIFLPTKLAQCEPLNKRLCHSLHPSLNLLMAENSIFAFVQNSFAGRRFLCILSGKRVRLGEGGREGRREIERENDASWDGVKCFQ